MRISSTEPSSVKSNVHVMPVNMYIYKIYK